VDLFICTPLLQLISLQRKNTKHRSFSRCSTAKRVCLPLLTVTSTWAMAGIAEASLTTFTITFFSDLAHRDTAPLTTTFTPASTCSTWTQLKPDDSAPYSAYVSKFLDTSCSPSGGGDERLYSPGICPSGYIMYDISESRVPSFMIGNGRLWIGHCCTRYVLLKGRQQYHDHAKGLATIITHLIKGRLRLNSSMTVIPKG
jgi:hypothetical protein